jgi:flagellar assembly protein FliH
MFSSDRGTARRVVRASVLAPEQVDALGGGDPFQAWLPDDLVAGDGFADLPDFGASFDAPADVDPATLAAQRAAEEAAWRQAEADRIAAEAEQAAALREQELQEAYMAGIEAGRAEGEAAAREELDPIGAALLQALADVRGGEQRWLGTLQENVAALATAIARHVIGREIAADPSSVAELVQQAVAEYPLDEPLTARVAPQDVAALKATFAELSAAHAPATTTPVREIRWVADAHVARGGVLVEGRERIVDGRVDTALERVYRRLAQQNA